MDTEDNKHYLGEVFNILGYNVSNFICELFTFTNTSPEKITKDLETIFKYVKEHDITLFTAAIKFGM